MFKILRAEFRRSFYHRSSLVFVGITLLFCILSLSFQIAGILGSGEKTKVLQAFQETFAFPNSLFSAIGIAQVLFLFIVPTAVAQSVGSDYHLNTWKMILPRTPQRGLLLFCKILNASILLIGLFLIIFASILISGFFGAFWLETSMFQSEALQISIDNQILAFSNISFIFWYFSVAVLATIVSRSVVAAVFVTFAFYVFCNLIRSHSPELLSIWFAPTHFGNLIPKPLTEIVVNDSSRPDVSSLVSWSIVIFHIIANFMISLIVLKKQDFSGE